MKNKEPDSQMQNQSPNFIRMRQLVSDIQEHKNQYALIRDQNAFSAIQGSIEKLTQQQSALLESMVQMKKQFDEIASQQQQILFKQDSVNTRITEIQNISNELVSRRKTEGSYQQESAQLAGNQRMERRKTNPEVVTVLQEEADINHKSQQLQSSNNQNSGSQLSNMENQPIFAQIASDVFTEKATDNDSQNAINRAQERQPLYQQGYSKHAAFSTLQVTQNGIEAGQSNAILPQLVNSQRSNPGDASTTAILPKKLMFGEAARSIQDQEAQNQSQRGQVLLKANLSQELENQSQRQEAHQSKAQPDSSNGRVALAQVVPPGELVSASNPIQAVLPPNATQRQPQKVILFGQVPAQATQQPTVQHEQQGSTTQNAGMHADANGIANVIAQTNDGAFAHAQAFGPADPPPAGFFSAKISSGDIATASIPPANIPEDFRPLDEGNVSALTPAAPQPQQAGQTNVLQQKLNEKQMQPMQQQNQVPQKPVRFGIEPKPMGGGQSSNAQSQSKFALSQPSKFTFAQPSESAFAKTAFTQSSVPSVQFGFGAQQQKKQQ